jgi:hypothetical protein
MVAGSSKHLHEDGNDCASHQNEHHHIFKAVDEFGYGVGLDDFAFTPLLDLDTVCAQNRGV